MCKKNRGIVINKQDFLSGRVINLIKETQKNIATARRENMKNKKDNWLDNNLIVMGMGSKKKNNQVKSFIQNKLMNDFINGKFETKKEIKKNDNTK
jgi:hypothetical protein